MNPESPAGFVGMRTQLQEHWRWAVPQPGVRACSASLPQARRRCSSPASATDPRRGQRPAHRDDRRRRRLHHDHGRSPQRRGGPAARLRGCPPHGRAAGQRRHDVPGQRGPCRNAGHASRPSHPPRHARRRGGRRSGLTTDEAEQGRTAHGRADPLGQACASLAAQREADVVLQITQARRPLRIWPSSNRQALGKDAVRAAGSPAPQPAHLHLDLHVATLPGQVCQPAKIAAVQP